MRTLGLIAIMRVRLCVASFQWLLLVVLLFSLSLLYLTSGVNRYLGQVALYQIELQRQAFSNDPSEVLVYSQVRLATSRPPEKLGILAEGTGYRHGARAEVRGRFGLPRMLRRGSEGLLLRPEQRLDFISAVGLVGTLLAILLASDTVARERRAGTLMLVAAHAVSLRKLVFGELLGVLGALLLPLLGCGLMVAAVFALHPRIGLDWETLSGWALILLALALVFTVFAALGLLISLRAREPATAQTIAFAVWVTLVVVGPGMISAAVDTAGALSPGKAPEQEVWSEQRPALLARVRSRRIKPERDDGLIGRREHHLRTALARYRWARRANLVLPFSALRCVATSIAGTSPTGYRRFAGSVADLDRQLGEWQAEKLRADPARATSYTAGAGLLDLSGLPAARPFKWPWGDRVLAVGGDLVTLALQVGILLVVLGIGGRVSPLAARG